MKESTAKDISHILLSGLRRETSVSKVLKITSITDNECNLFSHVKDSLIYPSGYLKCSYKSES